jgi:hypothetical protein
MILRFILALAFFSVFVYGFAVFLKTLTPSTALIILKIITCLFVGGIILGGLVVLF